MNLSKILTKKIRENFKKKRLFIHEPIFSKDDNQNLQKCINSTFVSTTGNFLKQFELQIKKYTKSKYVVLTNSATSALHLSLIVSKVQSGDEVIIPNLNYIAVANCIKYLNANPHLVDINQDDLSIDCLKLYKYLKKKTIIKNNQCFNLKTKKYIKSLVLLHPFGHPANINEIKKICKKFKIFLIEDAAECLGTFYKNRHLGTFAKIGVLSFNGNKIITTGGGGAVLTNSKTFYNKIKNLSEVSKIKHIWKYNYNEVGFNYCMTNLSASIGCSQLKNLEKLVKKKRKLFLYYEKLFKDIQEIKLFRENSETRSNYWLQNIILRNSNRKLHSKILNELNKNKIHARPAWILLNEINYLKKSEKMNLSNSKKIYNSLISLPSGPGLI